MFISAALAGVYQRIGGIIVKRIKSMLLLSLATLLCFAAMAMAAPKSLTVTDTQSVGTQGYFVLTMYQYNIDFTYNKKEWKATSSTASLPTAALTTLSKETLEAEVPIKYTGDVSIDVLTSLCPKGTNTIASNYWYTLYQDTQVLGSMPAPKPGLLTSCDYAVISDNTGKVILHPLSRTSMIKAERGVLLPEWASSSPRT